MTDGIPAQSLAPMTPPRAGQRHGQVGVSTTFEISLEIIVINFAGKGPTTPVIRWAIATELYK